MNDPLKADARRFRLSLAASFFLNVGLLVAIGRLGGMPDLSRPQGRPHLRMVTLSMQPAPPSSGRRGLKTALRLTQAADPSPRQPRPHVTPPNLAPRQEVQRRLSARGAAVSPAFHIVTVTHPSARTAPDESVPNPLVLTPSLPHAPTPIRIAPAPIRIPAASVSMPPLPVPVMPPLPMPVMPPLAAAVPPVTAAKPPTVRLRSAPPEDATGSVAVRHEASQGTAGGGAGWTEGAGTYTDRKAGGPFGIGDGLAADGVLRHVVYVLDTSGSMKSRLGRAEDELTEALRGLRPGETFNIVAFSGGSQTFDPDMAEAAPGNIQRASAFLSDLAAGGDTDLEDAIVRALMLRDVNEVVVLTDGVPTVGETDPERIAGALRRFNLRRARISTIGMVGRNADGTDDSFAAAQLLQRIARDSGGASKLVILGTATP